MSLLTALMIHDYSGPAGPIEQPRFHFFVGGGWESKFRATVLADLLLPCPHISLALGLDHAAVQELLNGVVRELAARDERDRKTMEAYYAGLQPSELSAVFGDAPPRRPRALFLTTRFSTVLQYATRDAAAGFEQAGLGTRAFSSNRRDITAS